MRESVALARGVLLGAYPFGVEEYADEASSGVAVGLRISTARLFELLLQSVPLRGGRRLVPGASLSILEGLGSPKRPDLRVLEEDRPICLLDAKYKQRGDRMPFADQYQQYAYASASGLPAGFVYVEQEPRPPTAWGLVRRGGVPAALRIAVGSVPFPNPSDSSSLDAWRARAAVGIEALLAAIL
jgi:hypothetical protein